MRKKFNLKSTILGIIIGGIVFGSIGVVATNYLLRAEDVEYVDKDNNTTTVQSAITDLYNKASSGRYGELTLGVVTSRGDSMIVPFDDGYIGTACIYGVGDNYDKVGRIVDNTCVMEGLSSSTIYKYKIGVIDSSMKFYIGEGTKETESVTYFESPIIVYFNPISETKCSDYVEANSTPGNSEGCMKWYAYKGDTSTYTMLLDHSISAADKSYYDIMAELEDLKNESGWKNLNTTTLTFNDIKSIVNQPTWYEKNPREMAYRYDDNCKNGCNVGENKYAWLFDRTAGCEEKGCYKNDKTVYSSGFWLLDEPVLINEAYWGYMSFLIGGVFGDKVTTAGYGLRPVITVNKLIIE